MREMVEQFWGGGSTTHSVGRYVQLTTLPSFIETLGVLVEEKSLTAEIVNALWGPTITTAWKDVWQAPVERLRNYTNRPETYLSFQRLAERLERLKKYVAVGGHSPQEDAEEGGGG